MCFPNLQLFSDKLGVGGSFLILWCYARGRVYGKIVSVFLMHFSAFVGHIGVIQLVSGFLSMGIASCSSIFRAWEEESSEASYVNI